MSKEKSYLVIIFRTLTETSLHLEGKIVPRRTGEGWNRPLAGSWDWIDATGLDRAKAQLRFRLTNGRWFFGPSSELDKQITEGAA
jgi:hypothetical protein